MDASDRERAAQVALALVNGVGHARRTTLLQSCSTAYGALAAPFVALRLLLGSLVRAGIHLLGKDVSAARDEVGADPVLDLGQLRQSRSFDVLDLDEGGAPRQAERLGVDGPLGQGEGLGGQQRRGDRRRCLAAGEGGRRPPQAGVRLRTGRRLPGDAHP